MAPRGAAADTLIPPELVLDPHLAESLLVDFVRRETRKAGFSRVLVGLSGGVDSATAAALASRALGGGNVICLLMPYRTSSPHSLRDARLAAKVIGAPTRTIPITPMVDAYFRRQRGATRLRRGNKMARERMAILYDQSARERGLVLGTSNKTELLLGYGTIHGDMASAINPIGDLYKTQVRVLALHLGVPERIVWKAPSADLWSGQSDEGELGYPYREIDRLLALLIDSRASRDEAVRAGFPRRMVDRITARIAASQFKRRPPVIAKLSPRTINLDFRYPRDWGR
ncbi:MAG TPA: NAD+ synthase [Candidatus Polarisedimenticolia bacterium]|nr:NAD+ synthase [Candidatus Polarisedimenticolia bacterium]